ncbi:MAG: helix-turn-helix domain-containing protein, partial [Candidatus Altiarchaeales archaeon]|nr:helix-turn-helix domain-containing protein [Candidatus Altiarchaeales archaeon]
EKYRYLEAESRQLNEEDTMDLSLPLQILGLVRELDGKLGKNKLAGILGGSKSKYIFWKGYDKLGCYGVLDDFTNKEIVAIMDELLERGYITYGGDPLYPTIGLTGKGDAALMEAEEVELETLSGLKQQKQRDIPGQRTTLDETLLLFREGRGLQEIAKIRGLKTATVVTHLVRLMEEGRMEYNLNDFVEPDVQQQITDAVITVGSGRSRQVKDLLPSDVSYDEIKLVCASLAGGQRETADAAEQPTEPREISAPLQVLKLIEELDGKLGKNKIAGILTGSRAAYVYENQYNEHRYYNSLSEFTKKRTVEIIDELLERGYLATGGNRLYPVIHLTKEGYTATSEGNE